MADLFDMNVGGLGFHLTSHVIAIAALFIACFAIAGYITFRDDSIEERKLKRTEGVLHKLVSPATGVGTSDFVIGNLPARSFVKGIQLYVKTLSVGAGTSDLDVSVGTTVGGAEIVTYGGAAAETIMINSTLQNNFNAIGDTGKLGTLVSTGVYSDTERTVHLRFKVDDAALTTAGEYVVNVIWGTY